MLKLGLTLTWDVFKSIFIVFKEHLQVRLTLTWDVFKLN